MLGRAEIVELLTRASAAPAEREQLSRRLSESDPPVFAELVEIIENPPVSADGLQDHLLVESADMALSKLVRARPEQFLDWASARHDSDTAVRQLSGFDGTVVDELLLHVLRTGGAGRGHAARALAERRDRRAVPFLVALLDDPDDAFAAVEALHVLADASTVEPLLRCAERSHALGSFGAEAVARDTVRWIQGNARPAHELRWFLVPHAEHSDEPDGWSWRNAAVVAAFDVADGRAVIQQTWARIETRQPVPAGTPRLVAGVELRCLRFPIRPGWPLRRGLAHPFSIDEDAPE